MVSSLDSEIFLVVSTNLPLNNYRWNLVTMLVRLNSPLTTANGEVSL